MRIFIHYKFIDKPWGGGNSFLRSFNKYCINRKIGLAKRINDDYDILFANAAHSAPGVYLSLDVILKQKFNFSRSLKNRFLRAKTSRKMIVYRSDGFRSVYSNQQRDYSDLVQQLMLQIADFVIFQNQFSLETARMVTGFNRENFRIIYNGVDQSVFKMKSSMTWNHTGNLKVLSVNWSSNLAKGYKEIAEFSLLPDVESYFIGNWPKEIKPEKVSLLPPMSHDQLSKEYQKYDVLLHPSKNDASPNVCLEALSCGLPIIYHNTSGLAEIASDCGVVYDEKQPVNSLNEIRTNYDILFDRICAKRKFFSMERCADEYLDVFRSLLR